MSNVDKELQLVSIDPAYINYLKNYGDDKDQFKYVMKEHDSSRPYIGVILNVNDINYYAPLTSLKTKKLIPYGTPSDFIKIPKMKNNVYMSGDDLNLKENLVGAININSMIPVPESVIRIYNIDSFLNSKNEQDRDKGKLLQYESNWAANKFNEVLILKNALLVYDTYMKSIKEPANDKIEKGFLNRCCPFDVAEKKMQHYAEYMKIMVAKKMIEKENSTNENKLSRSSIFSPSGKKQTKCYSKEENTL